jgi:hypothetical protein
MGYGARIPLEWRSAAPGDAQVARTAPEDLRRLRGGVCGVRMCDIGLRQQHTTLVHISRQANLLEMANTFKVTQYLAYLPSHYRLQPARWGNGAQRTELRAKKNPPGLSRTLNFTCMKIGDFTNLSRSRAPAPKKQAKSNLLSWTWHVQLVCRCASILPNASALRYG